MNYTGMSELDACPTSTPRTQTHSPQLHVTQEFCAKPGLLGPHPALVVCPFSALVGVLLGSGSALSFNLLTAILHHTLFIYI